MKIKILGVLCLLAGFSVNAFAGQNFVDRFLARYKPMGSDKAKPTPAEMPPDALTSFIRNGEIPLSVSDLMALTLRNNLDIGVDRLTPLSTEIAIESFYRPFDPTLKFSGNLNRGTTPTASVLSGGQNISQFVSNVTAGWSKYAQTGTTYSVDVALVRNSTTSVFSTFNPSWTTSVSYTASQHFLKGFGKTINTNQLKVLQNNLGISRIELERQVIDLLTQAERTYWDLVFTYEDLKVKQRSMDLAQKTLSDNRIQVDAGAMAAADLVQSETEVATRQEDLINSRYSQVLVSDQVKKYVTNGPDPGLVLVRIAPTQAVPKPMPDDVMPVEKAIQYALENRPELRESEYDLRNRDLNVQLAKNQLLPSLDITAGYTVSGLGGFETLRSGFGADSTIISTHPGGIGGALGQVLRNVFRGYNLQFNLQIPLSNRAAQSDYSRALIDKRTVENRVSSLSQAIALEVRNAITQVEMSSARIDAAQKVRELSERKLDFEQRKYDLGASTIRFVIEEQRNLTQAQTDEVAAMVSYAKALVDYRHAIGDTLKKNGVDLEKN